MARRERLSASGGKENLASAMVCKDRATAWTDTAIDPEHEVRPDVEIPAKGGRPGGGDSCVTVRRRVFVWPQEASVRLHERTIAVPPVRERDQEKRPPASSSADLCRRSHGGTAAAPAAYL